MSAMNLSEWVVSSCSKKGFADMHIDQFDPELKDRTRWIEGGVSMLELAVEARASVSCQYRLAVVYTLKIQDEDHEKRFSTAEGFRQQLDYSPPSVFIAEPGSEPWITSQADESVEVVSLPDPVVHTIFPFASPCSGLLMHYRPQGKEASTTVWFLQ